MGVEVGPVVRQDFVRHRKVQAVVVDRPLNRRPLTASRGGIVTQVAVQTGEVVKAGDLLLTLARDPIARPKPELTADLLKPISEDVHGAASRLRIAMSEIAVTQKELERIEPFVAARTIPGKTAIDLRYQLARSEQEIANARIELHTHGLTDEEIDAVTRGERAPRTRQLWKRSLEVAGLWTETSEALWAALPEAQRDLPWCIAAVGELSAAGMATDDARRLPALERDRARTLRRDRGPAPRGHAPRPRCGTCSRRARWRPRSTFAPRGAGPRTGTWRRSPCARASAWSRAPSSLRLYDARTMWLRLQPVGVEIGLVTRAMETGGLLSATPLIDRLRSGPSHDVRLVRMTMQTQEHERGGVAQAVVPNVAARLRGRPEPAAAGSCGSACATSCRCPCSSFPSGSCSRRTPSPPRVPTGSSSSRTGTPSTPSPCTSSTRTRRSWSSPTTAACSTAIRVVLSGAFALGLALGRGSEKVDPHAGHNHN